MFFWRICEPSGNKKITTPADDRPYKLPDKIRPAGSAPMTGTLPKSVRVMLA
jgi:hypothetical protein